MNQEQPKILLVEDESVIIELVTIYLVRHGYSVITISDGSQVMDTVKQEKPDLIIMDIMIPKVSGFELCRMIKSDPELKQIPVLMLSALVQKSEIEMGIRMGANIYMTKPFENSELLANIQKLLKERLP